MTYLKSTNTFCMCVWGMAYISPIMISSKERGFDEYSTVVTFPYSKKSLMGTKAVSVQATLLAHFFQTTWPGERDSKPANTMRRVARCTTLLKTCIACKC